MRVIEVRIAPNLLHDLPTRDHLVGVLRENFSTRYSFGPRTSRLPLIDPEQSAKLISIGPALITEPFPHVVAMRGRNAARARAINSLIPNGLTT